MTSEFRNKLSSLTISAIHEKKCSRGSITSLYPDQTEQNATDEFLKELNGMTRKNYSICHKDDDYIYFNIENKGNNV
jgi:hypothetical protein